MTVNPNKTVAELVSTDHRLALVFKKHHIDFCCGGNIELAEVLNRKNLNSTLILAELNEVLQNKSKPDLQFNDFLLDDLIDYILNKHHKYIEETAPQLVFFLEKLVKVHGERHPELVEICNHFKTLFENLVQHMRKEELVLFPFIKKLVKAERENSVVEKHPFGNIENPIQMMKQEHQEEGERFELIAALTQQYSPPQDACNTYKAAFSLLRNFEEDLHFHIHLENNILFPKSIDLFKIKLEAVS